MAEHARRDLGARRAGAVVQGRVEVRARDAERRARFLDAGGGDGYVVVLGERLADQGLEVRILEDLPPGRIRERRRLGRCLAAERRRLRHDGPLVVWADRAAAREDGERERYHEPAASRAR